MRVILVLLLTISLGASPLLAGAAGETGKAETPAAASGTSAAAEKSKEAMKPENSAIESEIQDLRSLVEEQRAELEAQRTALKAQQLNMEAQRTEFKAQQLRMEALEERLGATSSEPEDTLAEISSAVAPATPISSMMMDTALGRTSPAYLMGTFLILICTSSAGACRTLASGSALTRWSRALM